MDDEPTVLPIIRAIVLMAHSLGKRVIAEAIEHEGPVPLLMEMGEMNYQGYLLSRPMPAEEVNAVIKTWRSGIVMPMAFQNNNLAKHKMTVMTPVSPIRASRLY
jgi:sensor c-di-GMP phosphodiesterase-like protein